MGKIKILLCLLFIVVAPVNAQNFTVTYPEGEAYFDIEEPQEAWDLDVPFFEWHGAPAGYSVYDITNVTLESVKLEVIDTLNGTESYNGTMKFWIHFYLDNEDPYLTYVAILSKGQSETFNPYWELDVTWSIDDWGNRSAKINFKSRLIVISDDEWVAWARVGVRTFWKLTYVQSADPLYPIEIVILIGIIGAVIGLPIICCYMRRRKRRQIETAQEKLQARRREERRARRQGGKRK